MRRKQMKKEKFIFMVKFFSFFFIFALISLFYTNKMYTQMCWISLRFARVCSLSLSANYSIFGCRTYFRFNFNIMYCSVYLSLFYKIPKYPFSFGLWLLAWSKCGAKCVIESNYSLGVINTLTFTRSIFMQIHFVFFIYSLCLSFISHQISYSLSSTHRQNSNKMNRRNTQNIIKWIFLFFFVDFILRVAFFL